MTIATSAAIIVARGYAVIYLASHFPTHAIPVTSAANSYGATSFHRYVTAATSAGTMLTPHELFVQIACFARSAGLLLLLSSYANVRLSHLDMHVGEVVLFKMFGVLVERRMRGFTPRTQVRR